MRVGITGTPGTGKGQSCAFLARWGYHVVDLDAEATRVGAVDGVDPRTGSALVDIERLARRLSSPAKVTFFFGHYAHMIPVDIVIVLRCQPSVLRQRLRKRGWPEGKVRENVEAEALDVVTQEAVIRSPFVYEVDSSACPPEEVAKQILEILAGSTEGHEPGRRDWIKEALEWS